MSVFKGIARGLLKEGPFKFRLLKVYIVFETAILLTELVSVKDFIRPSISEYHLLVGFPCRAIRQKLCFEIVLDFKCHFSMVFHLLILLSLDLAKITLWKFKGFCPQ